MTEPRDTVRQFVVDTFLFGQRGDFNDQSSFLETGIVDSTGVLQVVAFLEQTFDFTVSDDELTPENLDSIDAISAFVARKSGVSLA
jgi:acyl carrier protein